MAKRRRLAIAVTFPLLFLLNVASTQVAALAQGPGGFKPAGNYKNTSMLASVFFNDPSGDNIFLFANRQRTVGPAGTSDETTIFLSAFANAGAVSVNCNLDDNSSDFNVAPDLSSATLHKKIAAGDPGCGGNLPSDLQLDVTWTGAGPIQSTTTTSLFMCAGYTDESQGNDSNNAGQASFAITGLDSPITTPDAQTFHFGSSLEHVQGAVPPQTCSGAVGRGAGRATPAAGNYHTTFVQADAASTLGGSFVGANLFANTSASNPVGAGGSSSSSETDLFFSTPISQGCFLLGPGNLTLGAASVSVASQLTGARTCDGGGNINPDPSSVTITWTASAPIATTMTQSQYACLGYHFQTSRVATFEGAATVSMSMPGLGGTLPDPGDFGSIDTRTHADGTPAPGCLFRG